MFKKSLKKLNKWLFGSEPTRSLGNPTGKPCLGLKQKFWINNPTSPTPPPYPVDYYETITCGSPIKPLKEVEGTTKLKVENFDHKISIGDNYYSCTKPEFELDEEYVEVTNQQTKFSTEKYLSKRDYICTLDLTNYPKIKPDDKVYILNSNCDIIEFDVSNYVIDVVGPKTTLTITTRLDGCKTVTQQEYTETCQTTQDYIKEQIGTV